jgi:octaprenyl-diphosphate synthase
MQGTLTLPAMMLTERHPDNNPIRKLFETRDYKYVGQAIDMVLNSSIIKDCYEVAKEYCNQACRNLKTLPKLTSRQSLLDLADYVIRQGT